MGQPVILIVDVGKTNKKVLLFDDQYQLVYEAATVLPETTDEDGFACEDVNLLTGWLRESCNRLLHDRQWDIRGINFSGYGASLVYLDSDGKPLLPLYNYLKPYPEALSEKFYQDYGGRATVAAVTASPALGSLNSGLQCYRLKHTRPDMFRRAGQILHLPQYLSFVISDQRYSDLTSIGCHTHLWDFTRNDYHAWVVREQLDSLFAPLTRTPKQILLGRGGIVGSGLHDSSAALVPYLHQFTEPFVLLSTGTWSISLNPFNHTSLTQEELQQDCLCYLTPAGKPVKAARLFAGHWHEERVEELAIAHGTNVNSILAHSNNTELVRWSKALMAQQMVSDQDLSTDALAYGRMMVDLMRQQVTSTNLILQDSTRKIFVDGGFSRNALFMQLLAQAYPQHEVYAATVSQASALGAAMTLEGIWSAQRPALVDVRRIH